MAGPTLSTHDRLHVTINRGGLIRLNENCYRLLGKPPAVYLYYSPEDSVIALEPVHATGSRYRPYRLKSPEPIPAK